MADTDFRTRARQLADKARTASQIKPGDDPYVAQARAPVAAAQGQMASAVDDEYSRRLSGASLSDDAQADVALRGAATRQMTDDSTLQNALGRRRTSLRAAYSSLSSQEAVEELRRKLEEEKKARQAKLYGDILGIAGMIGGFALGGPAGAVVGGGIGNYVGTKAGA